VWPTWPCARKGREMSEPPAKRQRDDEVGALQGIASHMTNAIDQAFAALCCPLTNFLPVDPVTAEDHKVYERSAIVEWLREHKESPVTKQPMGNKLTPATQVQSMIRTMVKSGAITGEKAEAWHTHLEMEILDETRAKATRGDGKAMYNLGMSYQFGKHGLKKNVAIAAEWFAKSHDAGEASGTACLGYCYVTGQGGMKNTAYGAVLLTEAACKGSKFAAYFLGICFAEGKFDFPKYPKQARRWYTTVGRATVNDLSSADQSKAARWLASLEEAAEAAAAETTAAAEATATAEATASAEAAPAPA